jgi:hypothetical protein
MSALSSTKLYFCPASAALLIMALGCGGSTDSSSAGGTGGSGGSAAAGGSGASGGEGGTGGATGGSGGSTGGSGGAAGGLPDAGDVICGGAVCPPTMFGMTTIPACCTTQNTCGVSIGGQATCFDPSSRDAGIPRPPEAGTGVPDPTCATLAIGAFMLTGCCMTDNTCGFQFAQLGGCTSLDSLRSLNLPGVNLPEGGPMSCVYPPP